MDGVDEPRLIGLRLDLPPQARDGVIDRPRAGGIVWVAPDTRGLSDVRRLHEADLARGFGRVVLPFASNRKFPNAPIEWRWQVVFPAGRICRDSVATRLLEDGYDVRTVQTLLGHRDVRTTMIHLHVMNRGALGVKSPMDRL